MRILPIHALKREEEREEKGVRRDVGERERAWEGDAERETRNA